MEGERWEIVLEHPDSALIFALLFEVGSTGQPVFDREKEELPHSIMVVRQILVLFVEVRTLVGQRKGFFDET